MHWNMTFVVRTYSLLSHSSPISEIKYTKLVRKEMILGIQPNTNYNRKTCFVMLAMICRDDTVLSRGKPWGKTIFKNVLDGETTSKMVFKRGTSPFFLG